MYYISNKYGPLQKTVEDNEYEKQLKLIHNFPYSINQQEVLGRNYDNVFSVLQLIYSVWWLYVSTSRFYSWGHSQ